MNFLVIIMADKKATEDIIFGGNDSSYLSPLSALQSEADRRRHFEDSQIELDKQSKEEKTMLDVLSEDSTKFIKLPFF